MKECSEELENIRKKYPDWIVVPHDYYADFDDPESIEYGINRSIRDVMGDCSVHGSLYAKNTVGDFDDAVYLSLSRTEGLMVFDMIQVVQNKLWNKIKAGIERAENEN